MRIQEAHSPSAADKPAALAGEQDPALRLEEVRRIYGEGHRRVAALDGVSLTVRRGSFVAVMGPSGSGKSTLLHCAAGLDHPTEGDVRVGGVSLTGRSETAVTKIRRERVGFVFQSLNLLPALTVWQNVRLPLLLAGRRTSTARCRAVLDQVGLSNRLDHRPAELSGGQQQRVAIARALVTEPNVIFADEPTGALDTHNAQRILDLLRESVDRLGQTVVMVTHDPAAAARADAVEFLADGKLVGRVEGASPDAVASRLATLAAPARPSADQGV